MILSYALNFQLLITNKYQNQKSSHDGKTFIEGFFVWHNILCRIKENIVV